jgi:SAM-dependent methyltransferase
MQSGLDAILERQGLVRRDPGIWFARSAAPISYPERGNALCLAVEETSFWFRHRNRCIIELVHRFRPEGLMLDIGGGNGFVARGLQQAGISCVLLEPGLDGARAAHDRGISAVICARFEDACLPLGSFGAAGLFDVVEHIEDDIGLLRAVRHVLRPDGRLFLTVPAYQLLFSADDSVGGHFRRYNRRSIMRVLHDAGFVVDYASYIFAPLPLPILLLRTIPSWFGRTGGIDPEQVAADHRDGPVQRILAALLDMEVAMLRRGWRVPVGATCLVAAHRA